MGIGSVGGAGVDGGHPRGPARKQGRGSALVAGGGFEPGGFGFVPGGLVAPGDLPAMLL